MTSTFGRARTGEDVPRAVEEAAGNRFDVLVCFKDGRPPIQGEAWCNESYHPDKDFGVMVEEGIVGRVVGVDYDEVKSIAFNSLFG